MNASWADWPLKPSRLIMEGDAYDTCRLWLTLNPLITSLVKFAALEIISGLGLLTLISSLSLQRLVSMSGGSLA